MSHHITPKYTASVTASGGREGHVVSDDGVLVLQVRRPKINGKSDATNPEQLFAAAWGACYQQALIGVAKNANEDASESEVTVETSIGQSEDGGSGLSAEIKVRIPGMEKAQVQALADAAHMACPYSKATRGNIDVEIIAV